MKSWSESNVFGRTALILYREATRLVEMLPEPADARPWRCHEVARAVGDHLGLSVVDGKCGPVEHSWLYLPPELAEVCSYGAILDGCSYGAILDVYAIGSLPQVQLRDASRTVSQTYVAEKIRNDIRGDAMYALRSFLIEFAAPQTPAVRQAVNLAMRSTKIPFPYRAADCGVD